MPRFALFCSGLRARGLSGVLCCACLVWSVLDREWVLVASFGASIIREKEVYHNWYRLLFIVCCFLNFQVVFLFYFLLDSNAVTMVNHQLFYSWFWSKYGWILSGFRLLGILLVKQGSSALTVECPCNVILVILAWTILHSLHPLVLCWKQLVNQSFFIFTS